MIIIVRHIDGKATMTDPETSVDQFLKQLNSRKKAIYIVTPEVSLWLPKTSITSVEFRDEE